MSSKESTKCPYSDSCFTCPLGDCAINDNPAGVNMLPIDRIGMHINRKYTRRKITQYTLAKNGEVRVYCSEKDACAGIGACYGYISECIRNGKTCKGWTVTRARKSLEEADE